MQTERLLQYADLLADVGLNIQPGQEGVSSGDEFMNS